MIACISHCVPLISDASVTSTAASLDMQMELSGLQKLHEIVPELPLPDARAAESHMRDILDASRALADQVRSVLRLPGTFTHLALNSTRPSDATNVFATKQPAFKGRCL